MRMQDNINGNLVNFAFTVMPKPNCHIENICYSERMPLLEQTQEGAYLYCRLHIRSSLNNSLATNRVN